MKVRGEAHIINCTFANDSSMVGGAIFSITGARPRIGKCLIAYSDSGGAIHVNDGTSVPVISCTDIFGNAGGDWSGDIGGMVNTDGDFSAKPQFCERSDGEIFGWSIAPLPAGEQQLRGVGRGSRGGQRESR